MSVWAVTGQSLGLIVGGAGLGMALGFGGLLWVERDRAGSLQEQLLAATFERYNLTAKLATCEATAAMLRKGRNIDSAIPYDLDNFVLPDTWRVQPKGPAD